MSEPDECDHCHKPIDPEHLVRVNGVAVHTDCLNEVLDQALGGVMGAYRKYFGGDL